MERKDDLLMSNDSKNNELPLVTEGDPIPESTNAEFENSKGDD